MTALHLRLSWSHSQKPSRDSYKCSYPVFTECSTYSRYHLLPIISTHLSHTYLVGEGFDTLLYLVPMCLGIVNLQCWKWLLIPLHNCLYVYEGHSRLVRGQVFSIGEVFSIGHCCYLTLLLPYNSGKDSTLCFNSALLAYVMYTIL